MLKERRKERTKEKKEKGKINKRKTKSEQAGFECEFSFLLYSSTEQKEHSRPTSQQNQPARKHFERRKINKQVLYPQVDGDLLILRLLYVRSIHHLK